MKILVSFCLLVSVTSFARTPKLDSQMHELAEAMVTPKGALLNYGIKANILETNFVSWRRACMEIGEEKQDIEHLDKIATDVLREHSRLYVSHGLEESPEAKAVESASSNAHLFIEAWRFELIKYCDTGDNTPVDQGQIKELFNELQKNIADSMENIGKYFNLQRQ